MMQVTLSTAAEFLKSRDNFLILTHRNPDGDTLGCAGALCLALRAIGKAAAILENPQTTRVYASELVGLTVLTAPGGEYTAVAVDLPSLKTIQHNRDPELPIDLVIDHHSSHNGFGERYLVFPEKSSCGEVIFDLLHELKLTITLDIARLLYIAISTDTGCFKFKNTNADTLNAAAELVRLGVPNGDINHKLFTVKRLCRLKLESELISNIELLKDGQLAIVTLTLEMLERSGADESDLEDIANLAAQPEGVEMAVTIREEREGSSKISVRTVNFANANKVCMEFGGGGHGLAAGVNLKSDVNQSKIRLLEAIDKWWGREN
jgi:phosphoesterase RecJ-like protein